jgi:hypothetical protein
VSAACGDKIFLSLFAGFFFCYSLTSLDCLGYSLVSLASLIFSLDDK